MPISWNVWNLDPTFDSDTYFYLHFHCHKLDIFEGKILTIPVWVNE